MLLLLLSSTIWVTAKHVGTFEKLNRTQIEELAAGIPEFSDENIEILRHKLFATSLDENYQSNNGSFMEALFEEKSKLMDLLMEAKIREYPRSILPYNGNDFILELLGPFPSTSSQAQLELNIAPSYCLNWFNMATRLTQILLPTLALFIAAIMLTICCYRTIMYDCKCK